MQSRTTHNIAPQTSLKEMQASIIVAINKLDERNKQSYVKVEWAIQCILGDMKSSQPKNHNTPEAILTTLNSAPPERRAEFYRLLIQELNTKYPERMVTEPALHDTTELSGVEKIKAQFTQYITKTTSSSLERHYLAYSILIEKEKLGLTSYFNSDDNIFSDRVTRAGHYAPGDFSNLDLSHLDLSHPEGYNGGNFKSLVIKNSNLTSTSFRRICLWGADFTDSNLSYADLSDLYDADSIVFKDADLTGAYYTSTQTIPRSAKPGTYQEFASRQAWEMYLKENLPYISLFETVEGAVDRDTKYRIFNLYTKNLLDELNDEIDPACLYELVSSNLADLDKLTPREKCDELIHFINFSYQNCTKTEKDAWIQVAIVDWLWKKEPLKEYNQEWFANTNERLKLTIQGELKNKPKLLNYTRSNDNKSVSEHITMKKTQDISTLKNHINEAITRLLTSGDVNYNFITRIGSVPKGIQALITLRKSPAYDDATYLEQVKAIANYHRSHYAGLGYFFNHTIRGRHVCVENIYLSLAQMDLNDAQSLAKTLERLDCTIAAIQSTTTPTYVISASQKG